MFAIPRGANGRRHEVDFGDDPITINVAMSPTTVWSRWPPPIRGTRPQAV
jgi:hypothetical protein